MYEPVVYTLIILNHETLSSGKMVVKTVVLIDDVRIYNYARAADQVRSDYNAGFSVHFK